MNVSAEIDFQSIQGFFDGIRPEPRITVSEWADQHRYLDAKSSAEPGKWRTNRVPYMRAVMDDLSVTSPVETAVMQAGAQVSKTEAGFNWIGYIIDNSPGPAMMVMPTIDTAKRNSKTRFDPMVNATPRLRKKLPETKSRDTANTIFQKDFPGGTLIITGANSASGLRSMPARYLFLDEVDAYPLDLDGEGSPIDLAEARTRTFAKRKKYLCSTPTIKGVSVINKEFLKTDQRKYFIPCPHCGHMQNLVMENLIWEKGRPETVMYYCEACGSGIEERFKTTFLLDKGYGGQAEWRPMAPENLNRKIKGYHLNSLYSPFGWHSWEQMARDYEEAEADELKMKAFINTQLGEPYEEQSDAPEWEKLYNRRLSYSINKPPASVVFITVGVDVQGDRLELEVTGWAKNNIAYSIDYRVILGDTSSDDVWNKLSEVVTEQWEREDGMMLTMQKMAVDAGFNSNQVYSFCRKFDGNRVIPVKGGPDTQAIMVTPPRTVDVSLSGKKVGKMKCWFIGGSVIKSELYGQLRMNLPTDGHVPKGFCFFPQYDENYFRMLTAEVQKKEINKRGYPVYVWKKAYKRNEALDCRVYSRACAHILGMDRKGSQDAWWDQFSAIPPAPKTAQKSPDKPRQKRPSFWD